MVKIVQIKERKGKSTIKKSETPLTHITNMETTLTKPWEAIYNMGSTQI